MTEEDGTQCQWADYTIRLIVDFRRLREDNEWLKKLTGAFWENSKEDRAELAKLRNVVDAAQAVIEEEQTNLKQARSSQKMINLEKCLRELEEEK